LYISLSLVLFCLKVKIIGDANVPKGQITFTADLSPAGLLGPIGGWAACMYTKVFIYTFICSNLCVLYVCIYIYVCMYTYMFISLCCSYAHLCICMHVYFSAGLSPLTVPIGGYVCCMYEHPYTCINIRIRPYASTFVCVVCCMYEHPRTCINICIRTYAYTVC